MAKQLIFCSVPHGLQPGRSGYCLMAGHNDLPQSLIRQLEQETSVFPTATNEDHAPWHEKRKIGETEWHLFIRQTTGIKDYTGRSSGLTHVIAERQSDMPANLDPKTVLWTFKNWVTGIPDKPEAFGEQQELDLNAPHSKAVISAARPTKPISKPSKEAFRFPARPKQKKPAPHPRSGIYYDGKRKKSSKSWWISFAVISVVVVLIIVL